jgi:hypothetical protein
MRAVMVEHPKFRAEVLHISELPDEVVMGLQDDNYGLLDTLIRIFQLGIIDPKRVEDFENLTTKELLECWKLYSSADAYEKEFFGA